MMADFFKIPGRKEDVREQVESLYQFVSKLSKELNFLLSNIDTINLSAELASKISIASGKNSIFTTQPTPPYTLGDVWIGSDFIKKCTTARDTGSYVASDWSVVIGTIVLLTATQTLTNKTIDSSTLNSPVINTPTVSQPDVTYGQASHNYGGGSSDWTLSSGEQKASTLVVTNSSGAANIIAPSVAGKRYTVINDTGYNITIKKTGGAGVTIAAGKAAIVEYIGNDYRRISADT